MTRVLRQLIIAETQQTVSQTVRQQIRQSFSQMYLGVAAPRVDRARQDVLCQSVSQSAYHSVSRSVTQTDSL